ncbi:hypothetical protein FACS1894216_21260 [Synergistales bacterium]|nr:hypothetical protein FACS1894216_21260 [Synergistales bacterium]
MSGPKYSNARIEEQRLRRLMKQIEENLEKERCKVLVSSIHSSQAELKRISASFSSLDCAEVLDMADKIIPDNSVSSMLRGQIKLAERLSAASVSANGNSAKLSQALREIENRVREFTNLMQVIKETKDGVIKECENGLNAMIYKQEDEQRRLSSIYASLNCDAIAEKAKELIPDNKEYSLFMEQIKRAWELSTYSAIHKGDTTVLMKSLADIESSVSEFAYLLSLIKETKVKVKHEGDKAFVDKKENNFKTREWTTESVVKSRVNARVQEIYQQLLEFLVARGAFEKTQSEIEKIVSNHQIDDQYKIELLSTRLSAAKVEANASAGFFERDSLRRECVILCSMLEKDAVNLPDSSDQLNAMLAKLQEELKQKTMAEYVADCMSEVMEDSGYNIVMQLN